MKRTLKLLMAAFSALTLPVLGWAANPTPVLLLDFGGETTIDDNTDNWQTLTELSGVNPSSKEYSVTGKDSKTYTVTHTFSGGGKVWNNGTWTDSFATSGEFASPDGATSSASALEEMQATLGLSVAVPTGVYKDTSSTGWGSAQTQKVKIAGLTVGQCYTLYFIGGLTESGSSPVPVFQLTAYDTNNVPTLHYAKHTDTAYVKADAGTQVSGDTSGSLLVRVYNLYPTAAGEIELTVYSVKSPLSAVALAETEYIAPPAAIARTLESAEETWSTATEWTDEVVPSAASIVELTVTSVIGSTLTLDTAAEIDQLAIAGDYALTMTGDSTLTVNTSTTVNTDTNVSGAKVSLGNVTIADGKTLTVGENTTYTSVSQGENALLYHTNTVSSPSLANVQGTVRFKNLTTSQNYASGVTILIGEGDEAVLESRQDYPLVLDGGNVSTTRTDEFWLGGHAGAITVNSGVMDVSSVTSNADTAAMLLYYTGNGGSTTINGGVVDAVNTSIVGWGSGTSLIINNGFLRTKGFRSNEAAFVTLGMEAGIVEIGAIGIQAANLTGLTSAVTAEGTIRAIEDAPVSVNLWTDGTTGSLQAVDGKILTVSSIFKGDIPGNSYTIGAEGGTDKTWTRADDGTYSQTDIPVNGTVKFSGATFQGETKTFIVKSGTLDMTAYDTLAQDKLAITLDGGTLLVKAGMEEGFVVPAGSTLQVLVNDSDIAYTATATGEGAVQIVNARGDILSETASYTPALSGKGAWYEFLFETDPEGESYGGSLPNTGSSDAFIRGEESGSWTFVDVGVTPARRAVRIHDKYPWTNTVPDFRSLETWSASFFAKMPTTEGGVLMGFGTTVGSNPGFIALVRGKGENKVLLVAGGLAAKLNETVSFEILADFTVPNAESTYHLYTFVRTPDGVEIYLDGEPWAPYNKSVTVGNGFQIGSLHGGYTSSSGNSEEHWAWRGYVYAGELTDYLGLTLTRGGSESDTDGAVDMLRIYRRALTDEDVQALAAEYTYISPNGSYSRTITADSEWIGDATAWTNDADASTLAEPPTGSVTVTTDAETALTMTMKLTEAKTFEALTLQGDGVTIVGAEGSAVASVTGLTRVICDATIDCGVVEMTGPVRVAEGATLTLDASEMLLETMLADKIIGTYQHYLTGPAEGNVVVPTLTYEGWDVTIAQDETNSWILTASRSNWYVIVDENDNVTWLAGNSLETAGEATTIPTASLAAPINIIANGDAYIAIPTGTTPVVNVSGTGMVQLMLPSFQPEASATITRLNVTETATLVLPQGSITVTEKELAETATLGYAATEEGWTISDKIVGNYGIRVVFGKLILANGNGDYSGTITVDPGATLVSTGEHITIPFGKNGAKIVNNGTLIVGGHDGQLPDISGTGDIEITNVTRIAGDITSTGTLTIGAATSMTYYEGDFSDADLTINGPSIVLNNALTTTNDGSSVTIASGKTISGKSTLMGDLTLANGAIVKPADNTAVSVYGTVNLPAEGTVTVEASEKTPFLVYNGTPPETPEAIFTVEAENLHVAAATDGVTVALKLVNVTAPTVEGDVTDEIAAKAVQAVVDCLAASAEDADKTVSSIANPETLSVITNPSDVTLTDNGDDTYTATFTYDFGVSALKVDGDYVIVTVELGEGLDFADGATVTLVAGEEETTVEATMVDESGVEVESATGPIRHFKTELTTPFKVKAKAAKTEQTNEESVEPEE